MKYIIMPAVTTELHGQLIKKFEDFSAPVYKNFVEWLRKGKSRVFITMPAITEEQHEHFIEEFRGFSVPIYRSVVEWLLKGTSRTVTRKGDAVKSLKKFIEIEHGSKAVVSENNRIHDNNGTKIATNGYIAAVILPEDTPEWDMSDAYIMRKTKDGTEKWTGVQESFLKCSSLSHYRASVEVLQELLQTCKGVIEERNGLPGPKRNGQSVICVDAGTMEALTHWQAEKKHEASTGNPIGFNAVYAETVLRFILCADADTEIYYSDYLSPIYLHAGNLYAILFPLRMKWESVAAKGGRICA